MKRNKQLSILAMIEPDKIREARLAAGLTQTQAANVVYVELRSWQRWEAGDVPIPLAAWELFLIKTNQAH